MSLFRNQALKCGPGTAPFHRAYVLLNSAIRPTDFPSRIDSPLRKTLFANLLQSNAIVNWSWSPSANHDASQGPLGANETCSATVFSGGNRLLIPNIHLGVVDQVSAEIAHHCESSALETIPETEVDILVCTHGARHCHCGETGGKVVELLHTEQAKRSSTKFNIKEVGHVGGHFENTANILVYPHGEWLTQVAPGDIPSLLDDILEMAKNPFHRRTAPPLSPRHWRGRMGFSKSEQVQLYDTHFGQA